jgi:hypothetical protein
MLILAHTEQIVKPHQHQEKNARARGRAEKNAGRRACVRVRGRVFSYQDNKKSRQKQMGGKRG